MGRIILKVVFLALVGSGPAAAFVGPLAPFPGQAEERRCPAIGSFLETFASQRLAGSRLAALSCEEVVDPPEAPWLAATVSYTFKNMTRILQLCVRKTGAQVELTLSATGGPCEDEYFSLFEQGQGVQIEADPGLKGLKPELLEWLNG